MVMQIKTAWTLALALGLLLNTVSAQVENRLVEREPQARQIALGYPIPIPVDSLTPVAGFRSYASLHARQQDLALRSPDLRAQIVGQTGKGRAIWAYVLGDADGQSSNGQPAPGMLINAAIHAREWQAPEVATAIIEYFMDGATDSGLRRFLLDDMRTVVIPVHNIDGFLMTQAHPDRVFIGSDPTSATWPREGRMRRKNLREADELFETLGDHLHGVDLNRNFLPFFASNNSSSIDLRNLTHHGPSPGSEAESVALFNSVDLLAPGKLRFFGDLHSFGRVLFSVRIGESRTDAQTALIARRFSLNNAAVSVSPQMPNPRIYADSPNPVNTGLGTTSEYFAYTYRIPAWTLELEPGNTGATEYGGLGWHHDGFILPASQISRLRDTMAQSHVMLAYHVAGPAILKTVRIFDSESDALVAHSDWVTDGAQRQRISRSLTPLRSAGRYRLWLGFDRPMRVFDESGAATLLPGQTGAAAPTVTVRVGNDVAAASLSNGQWRQQPGAAPGEVFDRYRGDAWTADLVLPSFTGPSRELSLSVTSVDAIGRQLDANPASIVDWRDGAWSGFENAAGAAGDVGGTDSSQVFAALTAASWVGAGSASRIGEGESGALVLERSSTASAATAALTYSAGLSGPATVQLGPGSTVLPLRVLDDLLVQEGARRLQISIQMPGEAPLSAEILAMDNDSAQQLRYVANNSAELIAALDPATAAVPRQILLAASARYELPSELPLIQGKVLIEGRGAQLSRSASNSSGRYFSIAESAELELRDLSLQQGGGADLDGGQVFSRGRLILQRVSSHGAQGRCGAAIWSSGQLRVERSVFVEARGQSAGVFCIAAGSADIRSSSISDARADSGALISNRGQSELNALSLSGIVSTAGPSLGSESGSLRIAASVSSGGSGSLCGAAVQSAGDNLFSPSACVSGGADLVTTETLLQDDPVRTGQLILRSGAWDNRSTLQCDGVDQLGLPRPQDGNCEAGARERGIAPVAGLWWTASRSGQGLDLKRAGDGLLVLLYTYDSDGRPITYTAQAPYRGTRWIAPVLRWRQAPVSLLPESTVTGELQLDFIDTSHANLRLSLDGAAIAEYPIEVFGFGNPDDPVTERTYSGAARYGLSFAQHGETSFALLYAYDADHILRWASAQNSVDPASMQLYSFTGSCPACVYQSPQAADSGRLRLRGSGFDNAAVDLELRFGVGAGGSLLREAALLERLDAP